MDTPPIHNEYKNLYSLVSMYSIIVLRTINNTKYKNRKKSGFKFELIKRVELF